MKAKNKKGRYPAWYKEPLEELDKGIIKTALVNFVIKSN